MKNYIICEWGDLRFLKQLLNIFIILILRAKNVSFFLFEIILSENCVKRETIQNQNSLSQKFQSVRLVVILFFFEFLTQFMMTHKLSKTLGTAHHTLVNPRIVNEIEITSTAIGLLITYLLIDQNFYIPVYNTL